MISKFLKLLKHLRFRIKTGDYMRVAYLSPRQVVLITSRLKGKENILPVDWHIPLSFSPKLYAISLESGNYSSSMIKNSGCFVVNFVSAELESKVLECGRVSGKDADKFELTGLEKFSASKIDAPVLKNALGYLECRLVDTIITGDHTLFVGEVVYEKETVEAKRIFHITNEL